MSEPTPQQGDPASPSHSAPDRDSGPPPPPSSPHAPGTAWTVELPAVPTSASPAPQPMAYPYPPGFASVPPTAPYAPISATPYPVPYSVVPAAPARRSAAAVVFGVLALLLLLGASGVSTLYLVDHNSASKKSADQQSQIASLQKQLDDTSGDLKSKTSELRRTQDDLDNAQAAATECPDAVQKFFEVTRDLVLAGKTQSPEATAAAQKMIAACDVHL